MQKIKIWIAPTVATIILAIFVIGSAILYNQVQKDLRTKESSAVAKAIALSLISEIKNVTRVLTGLSQIEIINAKNKSVLYDKISTSLIQKYPHFFYAINYINPNGIIEKIYPVKPNQLALGRNLMDRPELKPYLEESFKNKIAFMSHRVRTYQGIYAIIIYEPLFDQKQKFKGWMNAVINLDSWLKDQLAEEGWKDIYIQMHWQSPLAQNQGQDLVLGSDKSVQKFSYDFKVINQDIKMEVGLPSSPLRSLHKKLLYVLWVTGLVLLGLVSLLLYKLTASHYKLVEANQKLSLKNVLLNSLAHDVSNPLNSLGLIVEQVVQKKDSSLSEVQKARALKTLETLNEMLASVRSLSRLEMEKEKLKTQVVPLAKAVKEALIRVQDQAVPKKIEFVVPPLEGDLKVSADENTLVNNVIPNVLNNAIKFTKPQSQITISIEKSGSFVWLKVADKGRGFSENEILSFNQGKAIKSSLGSGGEIGSGLGLTQVKGFMQLYGGEVILENLSQGALIKLKFIAAS